MHDVLDMLVAPFSHTCLNDIYYSSIITIVKIFWITLLNDKKQSENLSLEIDEMFSIRKLEHSYIFMFFNEPSKQNNSIKQNTTYFIVTHTDTHTRKLGSIS